jgi:hypothetical protein
MRSAAPTQQTTTTTITNTSANPVPTIITSATQSFQASGGDAASGRFTFTVPAANRLAIETITISQRQATTGVLLPTVTVISNGNAANHALPVTNHPVDPARTWGIYTVRLYADPNTQVTIAAGNVQMNEFTASVSGYLVPVA